MPRVIYTDNKNAHKQERALLKELKKIEFVSSPGNRSILISIISVAVVGVLIAVLPGWFPVGVFLTLAALAFFAWRLDIGLLILIFFAPFSGLVINFANFDWSRGIPYLSAIDAPFADFFALIILSALILRWLVHIPHIPKLKINPLPLVGFFAAFVFAQLISLFAADYQLFGQGAKFVLRPIIFMYVMWVMLPNTIIQDAKLLLRALKVYFYAGVLSAVMGLMSLVVVGPFAGFWHRATPFGIGGIAPLGYNHNLLAEVLVTMIPIGAYLVYQEKVAWRRKWYFVFTALITAVALLTFARTAWIVVIAELIVFVLLFRHEIERSWVQNYKKQLFGLVLVLILPIAMYMGAISSSKLVAGSTTTRVDLTRIAWEYYTRSPIYGNGPGSFIPIIEDTAVFALEYGDPLDAHGMIQKIIAENGTLGLVVWMTLLAAIVIMVYMAFVHVRSHHDRALIGAMVVMIMGAMVYQLLNTSYYNAKMWLPIGLALVASQLVHQRTRKWKR